VRARCSAVLRACTPLQLSLVAAALERDLPKFAMPGALGFKGFNAVGVMWDWASLYQPPFASADEEASFCHARDDTMDIWFAHQGTAVYMLTQHPKARGAARSHGYRESGWTTFERCCAEQLKHCFLTDCRSELCSQAILALEHPPPPRQFRPRSLWLMHRAALRSGHTTG